MRKRQTFAIALAGAASLTVAVPAAAQFRDFFQFPFVGSPSNPFNPPGQQAPQAYESNRAPPPRKVETPPTSTIIVVGDLFADWLGYGLEQAFTDTPEIGIVRKIKPFSGLARYEAAKGDIQDWSQAIKDLLATDKPAAIVIMLGVNDRVALRERAPAKDPKEAKDQKEAKDSKESKGAANAPPAAEARQPDGEQPQQPAIATTEAPHRAPPGGLYEFHSDKWAELYSKRIDDMIAALKAKGVPVFWVGLPSIRGPKSTSDMSYLDDLFRTRAEKAGIPYVDIWDGFVDEKGNFALQGPDFEGQTRRLRSLDGVYFTKPGGEKLAHYVEHELRRVITNPVVPVALPGPEEPAKGNAVGTRPPVGPILPLGATATGEGGYLLGAPSHPTPASSDPIVTRVLSHGEAIAAPPGRADDFSWPRSDVNTPPDTTPEPVVSAPPAAPAAKGANKGDANKNAAGKNDTKRPAEAKTPAAPNVPPRPNQPRASLDGAPPRPPLPVGTGRD